MINNVVLIGRLTRDVELHRTPQDQAVGQFTLAVNRNFKNQDGGYDADFRRSNHPRQHLSPLLAPRQQGRKAARRPARLYQI